MPDEPVWCEGGCGYQLHTPQARARRYGRRCWERRTGRHERPVPAPAAPRRGPGGGMLHEVEDDVLLPRGAVVAVSQDRPAPQHSDLPEPKWTVELCQSCEAGIIWAQTSSHVAMPVDAEPTPDGNVALMPQHGQPLARVLSPAEQFGRTKLRKAHFASCPQGATWRRDRHR